MQIRKEFALKNINLKGKGLELGPLYSPLVAKSESNVFYVDHMSVEDLREKYKDEPVPLDQLVPVDYVLGNTALKETVGRNKFDYVVASHVIEHIPDTVRWLKDVASVLEPGGALSLVIPDKRYMFDITRNVSRPADIMGAYLDKRTKPSSAAMYDFVMESRAGIDPGEVWANNTKDYSHKPTIYDVKSAYQKCLDNLKEDQYVDCHIWVFTPYSFVEILRELIEYDIFDFEVASFDATPENRLEFYVTLRKVAHSKRRQMNSLPSLPEPRKLWQAEAELLELRARLDALTNSRSWKVTRPLRLAKKLAKRDNNAAS